jgi:P pilus assembly chaperone PapD
MQKLSKKSIPVIALLLVCALLTTALAVLYVQRTVTSTVNVYHSRSIQVVNPNDMAQNITSLNWTSVKAQTNSTQSQVVRVIVDDATVQIVKG